MRKPDNKIRYFSTAASIDAKLEREKRLVEATERAREARANDKVIKGELPTMERYACPEVWFVYWPTRML